MNCNDPEEKRAPVSEVVRLEKEWRRLREIEDAARIIFVNFQESETQGYRSRDRQYVIDMLKPYFQPI